ncbi:MULTISPECIES: Panacea domain-containing protein [Acinetobacter]|uniref:Panacea domain-containing protein n=1 Tax=Acinetobacter TaxID=469 RepID=UPI0025BCA2F8|nr:type II toxin-antitoxin system antitoxin SocA domain-containing protein [Acinetobacter sp. UBA801]
MGNKYTAMDVANYIIWYVNNKESKPLGSLTPLKLQKILYYVTTSYLKKTEKLIINDSFEKWQYGPVVTDVYHCFKNHGISHLKDTAPKIIEDDESFLGFKKIPFKQSIFDEDQEFKEVANKVIETLINFRAFDLVEMTHDEYAWKKYEPLIQKGTKELKYSKEDLLNAKDVCGI